MKERLLNVYFEPEANEGCWVIVSDKMKWTVLEHEISRYDCDDFLEMVSNFIDEKEYEKSIMIKKHQNEIKVLKDEIKKLKGQSNS